jgi:tRNA-dihydrouridine synthase A
MRHRLCVAPMMDVTDRHCRYFLRQLNSTAFLYTEMITTGALLHGDVERHLAFSNEEHPVALQLGGCDPRELSLCSNMGEQYGYDEINLNIGCPSERVQKGAFGACLMAEPDLVAECVSAMQGKIPVTVKHRTGVNSIEDYGFLTNFVATVAKAGCKTFIVHARNAILKGLSPKENREIPPLKYQYVYRLKQDFPDLEIVLNGGITAIKTYPVDGIMIGRAAVNDPWILRDPGKTRAQVVRTMVEYAGKQDSLRHVTRHLLGLYHGMPRARRWRQMLSDSQALKQNRPELLLHALDEVEAEESRIGA